MLKLFLFCCLPMAAASTSPPPPRYQYNLTSGAFKLDSLVMGATPGGDSWWPGAVATVVIKGSTSKLLTAGTVRVKIYELGQQHFIAQEAQEYFSCNNKGCDKTRPIALKLADPSQQKNETTFTLYAEFTMPAKQSSGQFTVEIWGEDQDHQPYDFEVSLAYASDDAAVVSVSETETEAAVAPPQLPAQFTVSWPCLLPRTCGCCRCRCRWHD